MAKPEALSGRWHELEAERAVQDLNQLLFTAASPELNCLGSESAKRLLEVKDDKQILDIGVLYEIQKNIHEYNDGLPIIAALRTADDFPIGSRVLFRNSDRGTHFQQTSVTEHIDGPSPRIGLDVGEVLCYVLPGYAGLMTEQEFYFIKDRPKRDSTLPTFLNLAVTRLMTLAGVGDYCNEPLYGYLVRLGRIHESKKFLMDGFLSSEERD